MNALANSQEKELKKFLCRAIPMVSNPSPLLFTQGKKTKDERKQESRQSSRHSANQLRDVGTYPHTTRELQLINAAQGLRFLVLDELHTYRGRQGADVAILVRRVRDRLATGQLQCVGTSATLASTGTYEERQAEVASVASQLFGATVQPEHVIGETLRRITPDRNLDAPEFIEELTQRVSDPNWQAPKDYQSFIADPLSIWIESTFGIRTESGSDRLVRAQPRSISGKGGAAQELSQLTGVP
jgi:hypothetical protein